MHKLIKKQDHCRGISCRELKRKKYLFRDIHNDFIGQGHYGKVKGQIKVTP